MIPLPELKDALDALRARVAAGRQALLEAWKPALAGADHKRQAANLAAYIAFRREDLRALQERLSDLGLSSLGRCESHVEASLDSVALVLDAMACACPSEAALARLGREKRDGDRRLRQNTRRLLGREPKSRRTRIMVTLPTAAALDSRFVRDLVERGMDLARINCAHDDPDTWQAMIDNVRGAAQATGRACLIHMDLAGPKLRTGDMAATPGRLRLKPKRDERGDTRAPAYFLFDASGEPGGPGLRGATGLAGYPRVGVPRDWLLRLQPGDLVEATDARGKKRILNVLERMGEAHVLACAADNVWLEQGCDLKQLAGTGRQRLAQVGPMEDSYDVILVHVGDRLLLSRDGAPGEVVDAAESGGLAGRMPCAQPEVVDQLRVGERVFIDDGQIGAEVERVDADGAWLRITRARPEGEKIRPAKGLNFPDSDIRLPALGEKDLLDLDFVARAADIVGYSFVQSAADMDRLADELEARGAGHLGRIAKIETRRAVANLPGIIVHGAGRGPFGLMIARGDLAVEIGWSRLAEIQEEILWLAEAAHVPVVWATQVFEQLIKENLPSRAEMTDAAMSERAECVMLNKGPFVLDAIALLDDIARRMRDHQHKKSARLRALHW